MTRTRRTTDVEFGPRLRGRLGLLASSGGSSDGLDVVLGPGRRGRVEEDDRRVVRLVAVVGAEEALLGRRAGARLLNVGHELVVGRLIAKERF